MKNAKKTNLNSKNKFRIHKKCLQCQKIAGKR